jgi:hypothetical protein
MPEAVRRQTNFTTMQKVLKKLSKLTLLYLGLLVFVFFSCTHKEITQPIKQVTEISESNKKVLEATLDSMAIVMQKANTNSRTESTWSETIRHSWYSSPWSYKYLTGLQSRYGKRIIIAIVNAAGVSNVYVENVEGGTANIYDIPPFNGSWHYAKANSFSMRIYASAGTQHWLGYRFEY